MNFDNIDLEQIVQPIAPLVVSFSTQIISAIILLIVGLWAIRKFTKIFKSVLNAQSFDASIVSFLGSLFSAVLKILLVLTVLSVVGIQTTSFIALIGAAGIAIGAALSGTLQNFASGVMILIFKPYKVGDYISAQDEEGFVKEIQIFNTIVRTPSNVTVIIPNSQITSGIISNHSTEELRRVDMVFGIGYEDDIDKAKRVILETLAKESIVSNERTPLIEVKELGDSSVNIAVCPWVNQKDYIPTLFTIPEKIKKAFDANDISIPFPQRDIHIDNKE